MKHFAICILLIGWMLMPSSVRSGEAAHDSDPIAELFKQLNGLSGEFAKFVYLTSPEVQDDPDRRQVAAQMLATYYSFLGRPNDALRAFPSSGRPFDPDTLPGKDRFHALPASDWIEREANRYPIVMVNEAHHSAQTRLLTLTLLPRLYARGFRYLAVETLADQGMHDLKYPTKDTGYYTSEPVFAEVIREALRLGYELVPYEPATEAGHQQTQQERETGMARNIIDRVLAKDPQARILVHAGYAHIGKKPGSAANQANPMAMELMRLSGLPILSVDQTSLAPYLVSKSETPSNRLNALFDVEEPSVLLDNQTQQVWSYRPGQYDATVLLPKASPTEVRPDWLALGGRRKPVAIDLTPCLGHFPCLAEARYASEGGDAIPADQLVVLADNEAGTPLYLAPGEYRLRFLGNDDAVVAERPLIVPADGASPSDTP